MPIQLFLRSGWVVYLSVHVWKSLVAVLSRNLHAFIHWSRWFENAPWRCSRLGTVQKVSVSHFGTTSRPAECQRRNVSQFSAQQCRLRWRLRVNWRKDDMHVIYACPARLWLFGDLLRNCEHFKFASLSVQLFFTALWRRYVWNVNFDVLTSHVANCFKSGLGQSPGPIHAFFKKKIDKMCRLQAMGNALAITPDSSIAKTRSWSTSDERGIFHRRYGAKCSICEFSRFVCRFQKCALWMLALSSLVPMSKNESKGLLGNVRHEWQYTRLETCVAPDV